MQNQMIPMTPDEALTFLDTVCMGVSMGRPAHVQGVQAVQVLKQFISNSNGSKPTEEENAKEEDK